MPTLTRVNRGETVTLEYQGAFMKTTRTLTQSVPSIAFIAALAVMLGACGGDAGSGSGAAQPGANAGQAATASAGESGSGPDTSQLAEIILGKINQDPTRMEMKVTGKLVDFKVNSAKTEVYEGMGAATVVECAGTVVFDGDVHWNYQDTEPKKAGEPAQFECKAEYANEGNGWHLFGPMGIYPL
jgi:hypothetical protein